MPICPGYEKTHSASLELRVGLYPFTALLASLKGFRRYVGLLRATLTVKVNTYTNNVTIIMM